MNTLLVCPKCETLNRVALELSENKMPVCGHCKSDLPAPDGVQDLSATALGKLIKSADRPVVVDFWAEWCGPCKAFAPTFKSAARASAGKIIFAKLNTELYQQASQAFQIRSIPTLIVFKNGSEANRQSGATPLPMLTEYLKQF